MITKKALIASLALVLTNFGFAKIANASVINWVDFSTYTPGALSGTGFSSEDGLVVDVEFLNATGFNSGSPESGVAVIDDPTWPFDGPPPPPPQPPPKPC